VIETGPVRVDHIVTSGTFSLDGGTWDVDNNVWLIGDDAECILIDAPHDAEAILAAIGDRRLVAILCTHAHDDHVDSVLDVEAATGAPIWLHPDDRELWGRSHPDRAPDGDLDDGQEFGVGAEGAVVLRTVYTPGHSWGSVCFVADALGVVFTGDTLFSGGPGATGRSYSDFPTIITSIRDRLLVLPPATVVHTGHGDDTTIGAEAPHLQEWIARGH
jgi:glyoxylase-like metal-dependent hydrolase (beta-lactamase superfamily II)